MVDYHHAVVVLVITLDAVPAVPSDSVEVVPGVARDKDGFGRVKKVLNDVVALEAVDHRDGASQVHEDDVERNETVDQHDGVDLEVEDQNDVDFGAD